MNKRLLGFAKRNFLEIVREPLSLVFCLIFPIVLLLVFKLITMNISSESLEQLYQFKLESLVPSIAVFGFSFLTLFSGMLIAKDRYSSFLNRLKVSPMKGSDFIIGYLLPLIPIAIVQVILTYIVGFILGLKFSFSLLLSIVFMIPIALIFICFGLLFGIYFSDKAIGGISSLLINFSAIFSGMFMPIETMGETILTIAKIFPFYNSLRVIRSVILGTYQNDLFLYPLLIVLGYLIILLVLTIILFKTNLKKSR